MKYQLLNELLPLLDEFEAQNATNSLSEFTLWLNNRLSEGEIGNDEHENLLIPFKIMHLNKTLKRETKQVLAASPVASIDEYSFLLHLNHTPSFRKMEIINLHNLEAPTGIEIIRRLLRNGLVEEFPDPEDKRAKRIEISEKGKDEIARLEPKIKQVFEDFSGLLNPKEKVQVSEILGRLISGESQI